MTDFDRTSRLAALFDARQRLDLALAVIPTIHRQHRERMLAWFDRLVRDVPDGVRWQLGVIAPWQRQRVSWRLAAERERLAPVLLDSMRELGASTRELSTVCEWAEAVGGARLGAWLEAGPHGLEAGWFCPEPMDMARALELAPDTHDCLAVRVWAKEFGIDTCVSCTRSVHPANPWTEICVALPGAEALDQLCAARVVYKALGMPAPDNQVYAALLHAATSDFHFVLGLSAEGPIRIGITVPTPQGDGLRQLARIGASSDPERSDAGIEALRCTLDTAAAPHAATWLRDATGVGVELSFDVPIRLARP